MNLMWNWFKKSKTPTTDSTAQAKVPTVKQTPKTFGAENENRALNRPAVFDPALLHFRNAYRAGEPYFQGDVEARLWMQMREQVIHHILQTVKTSPDAAHLVLRGSITLRSWLGDRARYPGDLDWVLTPTTWKLTDRRSKSLISDLVSRLHGTAISETLQIPDRPFAMEEIWTYEKAPGQRIVVPWKAADPALDGTVQMDFVFGEAMPSRPETTGIAIGDFPPIQMQTASREQSLAWKLLWLSTDMHTMGKDLYDAVLLSETTPLEFSLLEQTFADAGTPLVNPWAGFSRKDFQELSINWGDIQKEYPQVAGNAKEWRNRLVQALEPIWRELERNK